MECFPLESPSFIWYLKDTHSLRHIRKSCEHTGRKRPWPFPGMGRAASGGLGMAVKSFHLLLAEEKPDSEGSRVARLGIISYHCKYRAHRKLNLVNLSFCSDGFPPSFPSCRNSSWVTRINTFALCCWEGSVVKCLPHKHNKQTLVLWEHIQLSHRHVALPVTLELRRQRQDLYGKLTN